ncbi:MAG TPA: OmpA family protein [Chitinophagaceae bacterium]|nr:OmpA family protein [Chitinophagaceae bacterium]
MKSILLSMLFMVSAVLSMAQQTFNTKYDFVPGEKLIAYEDFSAAQLGDFPVKWNTNATAEVVTLNNKPGKWFKINKEGVFHPEFINNLPENFTLEFDLGINPDWNAVPFVLNIASFESPDDYRDYHHYVNWRGSHAIHFEFQPAILEQRRGNIKLIAGRDGNHSVDSDIEHDAWDNGSNNFAHISIWRQNQRLRVYVNGEKVFDVPRVFDSLTKYNAITFAAQSPNDLNDYFVINNIRLAVGAADTRNKMMTQGKFVTRGILFDPNTASLQPASYGVLKDISNVLKENPGTKFRIIGHTDSDGDDKFNADLSRRRAAAVKDFLVKEFGIDANNLEIEGKGESAPVDNNNTVEGKANNRRVEFVKLK